MGHCTVFVCPSVRSSSDSAPPRSGSRRSPSLLKWVLSLLVCCWGSRHSRDNSSGDNESGENIEMGPMTLREYIATLQPYDPEIHGWRGDEPWTLRRRSRSHGALGATGATGPATCHVNGAPARPCDSPAYASVSYHPRSRGSRGQVV